MGQVDFLCRAFLRIRSWRSPEPLHALDLPCSDARRPVRLGVWLHLEGRQANAPQVLKTDLKGMNK